MVDRKIRLYRAVRAVFGGHGIGNLYPIRKMNEWALRKLAKDEVIVDGHRMQLDKGDTLQLSVNGVFEEYETLLVKRFVKEGDIVLDIGANIGYYTLLFAKIVGDKGKVYAFEPDPGNFRILKRNVEMNGYNNVILIEKAVSDKTGKIRLYVSEDQCMDHRIYDSEGSRKSIEIQSIKLDDYFKGKDNVVDFIKMDIQGAEHTAIIGMAGLLKGHKKLRIISELWPIGLKRAGTGVAEYIRDLEQAGFNICEVDEKKRRIIPTDARKLLKKYPATDKKYTNILCEKDMSGEY